ncbi:MAG: hypothetical protein QNJ45_08405 [Ardenticatenaceae bacterium]|nr:hypothetical protein [Ardenticatenaceae bacterium]
MNDFWEMFIPAVTISTIFIVIFGFLAFMRYMRYKETVALAERGLLRSDRNRSNNGRPSRRLFNIGVVLLSVGVGFFCTLIPAAIMVNSGEPAFAGVILGVLPASVGTALLVIDRFNNKNRPPFQTEEDYDEEEPIPAHKNQE